MPAPIRFDRSVRWRAADITQFIELDCPKRLAWDIPGAMEATNSSHLGLPDFLILLLKPRRTWARVCLLGARRSEMGVLGDRSFE